MKRSKRRQTTIPTSNKTIPDIAQQNAPAHDSTTGISFQNIFSSEKEKPAILAVLQPPLAECIPEEQVKW